MNFSAASLVPNRSNRPGYTINKGSYIESGDGNPLGAKITDGMLIAVEEHVNHDRRTATYSASTAQQFSALRMSNPHLSLTAWFFLRDSDKWVFVGFGESTDSLWPEGDFAAP